MEKQFLLEDETVLVKSDDGSLVLTNCRLLNNNRESGNSYFMSMHLQNISTIEVSSKSVPLLIVLGVFSILGGAAVGVQINEPFAMIVGVIIGLLFILLFFLTRYHAVNVKSNGGSGMHFRTKGMKREAVLDLVTKIDQAKKSIK